MIQHALWLPESGPWLRDRNTVIDHSSVGTPRPSRQSGRCRDFNGTNQSVLVANMGTVGATSLTIVVCFESTDTLAQTCMVRSRDLGALGTKPGFYVVKDSAENFEVVIEDTSGNYVLAESDMTAQLDGTFHLAIATFDSTAGTLNTYLDDPSSVFATSTNASMIGNSLTSTTGDCAIGTEPAEADQFWNGKLFFAGVILRVITADERALLWEQFNNPKIWIPGQPTDYNDLLTLSGTSETVAYNSVSGRSHGVITGYAAGFNYEGSDVPWPPQNLIGYGTDSTVHVPARIDNPSVDARGIALEFAGRAPRDNKLTGAPCVTFNGTTQFAQAADNAVFDGTDLLFIAAWCKNNATSPASVENIWGKYDSSGNQREWTFRVRNTGELDVVLSGDGTAIFVLKSTSTFSDWDDPHHVAATIDLAGATVKLYRDGQPLATTVHSGSMPGSLFNGTAQLHVGKLGGGTGFWAGEVWGLDWWKGASAVPSDADVLEHYNSGGLGVVDGQTRVVLMPCNEGTGTDLVDVENGITAAIQVAGSNWGTTQDEWHYHVMKNGTLISGQSSMDCIPNTNEPDLRQYSLPGDGVLANYGFNGTRGHMVRRRKSSTAEHRFEIGPFKGA